MMKGIALFWLVIGAHLLAAACTSGHRGSAEDGASSTPPPRGTLALRSTAFSHQGEIPRSHTCEGADTSPPLTWTGVPSGTKSLALVVEDPDAPDPKAPRTIWIHWVVYNMPPTATGLEAATKSLPTGARLGRNDWKRVGYGGPCPPIGRHRYFHRLFALDTMLSDLGEPTKTELMRAMEGHVLDQAELIGTYEKSGDDQHTM